MAKKGAMKRDPKVSTQPVRGEGEQAVGDRATRRAAERAARRTPTERLSPGVYRSASGDLVGQGGRPIQRQPQAPMSAPKMGQQFGQMPGQAEGLGQQLGQAANAANMGQQFGQMPGQAERLGAQIGTGQQFGTLAMQDKMYRMTPEESGNFFARMGMNPGQIQNGFGNSPMQNPWAAQMPQPSANMGGQYRLSPGMYGSREQAMRQYDQQMRDAVQPYLMSGVPQQRKG